MRAEHGGRLPLAADLSAHERKGLLDFSTTVHAYGPPSGVRQALREVCLDEYPDPDASAFCGLAASVAGVPVKWVMAGNGSVEILRLIPLTYVRPRDPVLIIGPTFDEYRVGVEVMGGTIHEVWARPETGFRQDICAIVKIIRSVRPRLIFLCNPNNPTGHYLAEAEVREILRACEEGILVMDEAFVNFVSEPWPSAKLLEAGPIILVRSMTKDYALPGVRLGYALGDSALLDPLRKVQLPWSISSLAQAAGIAAFSDKDYLPTVMRAVRKDARGFVKELRAGGIGVMQGAAHFCLISVTDGDEAAASLRSLGMLVRSCQSFGLKTHIRVGPRRPEENARLIEAIRTARNNQPSAFSKREVKYTDD
jgi:histidinol-phosphate aminotransferase